MSIDTLLWGTSESRQVVNTATAKNNGIVLSICTTSSTTVLLSNLILPRPHTCMFTARNKSPNARVYAYATLTTSKLFLATN